MGRRSRKGEDEDNGFAAWGGYMEAKKAKLAEQFTLKVGNQVERQSDIFKGVAILVNGYTKPSADELRLLMMQHGGVFHLYQNQASTTTHIIASNLPNVKINKLGNIPVVNPDWITDSIAKGSVRDYKKYLLYTKHSRTQPKLNFTAVDNVPKCTAEKAQGDPGTSELTGDTTTLTPAGVMVANGKQMVGSDRTEHVKPTLTASDPRFLAEFYNNSRLHLISTLGAEFKQLVNQLREKSDGQFPGRDRLLSKRKITQDVLHSTNDPVIMHIDMDCFFVSVGLRKWPHLRGKPVAVTHARGNQSNRSGVDRQAEIDLYIKRLPEGATPRLEQIDNQCSLSEIASCSYEARACGIKNGMFLGAALKLCPDLVPIPYDFQGYREVSSTLYNTIADYTLDIEAVSCDEMYVDVTKILAETRCSVDEWATHVRSEISAATGCPCSTGFGSNRLQARLATRKAKPNGQYHLRPDDVEEFMCELPLADLPGVGRTILAKLNNLGLITCGEVQRASLSTLRSELGQKNSETIFDQAKGIDRKPLSFEHERKSVSAEINYGIRFKTNKEALIFIESLANEVYTRLVDTGMKAAKCVTLKLMVRAQDAPKETAKFLGHGVCDSINRSTTTTYSINDPKAIFREAKSLYGRLNITPQDLRGVGIQLSRLEKGAAASSALANFLSRATEKVESTRTATANCQVGDTRPQDRTSCVGEVVPKRAPSEVSSGVGRDAAVGAGQSRELDKSEQAGEGSKMGVREAVRKKEGEGRTVDGNLGVSKKGRGKGTTSRASTSKFVSNNGLTDYFRSGKQEKKPKQVTNIRSADIDLDVLNQLPEELRNEIIKEYDLQMDISQDSAVADGRPEKQTDAASDTGPPIVNTQATIKDKKKDFGDLNYDQLKALLRNWMASEGTPQEFDVNMLGEFLKNLAIDRQIERLFPLMNFLHRNISKHDCIWHDAYFKLTSYLQEGMVIRYGCTLSVPRHFECSQHS